MGMFDDVEFEMKCPLCGELIKHFQTKDMLKGLSSYKVKELWTDTKFYSTCENCNTKVFIFKGKET